MPNATLAILNANIITLDAKKPKAQATAIYDGKIIAVGSNKEIQNHVDKQTKIVDAKNWTIVPGLVDCHVHMTSFGWSLRSLDLRNVKSIKEMQQKLEAYAKKNRDKSWIIGGRWDQEKFAEKRYPNRWDLDKSVADKPVFLTRVCGHTAVVNSKAMQLARITKKTKVSGGEIDLDEEGEPNGMLKENALELVWKAMPKPSLNDLEETCLLACKKAVELGLTGVHWIIDSADEMRILQKLDSEGKLPLRVYLSIPLHHLYGAIKLGLITGFGNNMVKIGFVKVFVDGSLGSRTAALKKPYSDESQTSGILLQSQKKLEKIFQEANQSDLQLGVHAIGDRAVEAALKAFAKVLQKKHRHRIEHCSVLNRELVEQMKRLGIVASIQPHFVVSDFWAADRVGEERARWVYPFKTLMREGIIIVSGSDCPVEPISPLLGVWAAVTRESFPEERLTVEEALKTYTLNAAYASFDEKRKGTISAGKFADLTILSDDLNKIPPDKIKDVKVEMVIVDGKIAHKRRSAVKRSLSA